MISQVFIEFIYAQFKYIWLASSELIRIKEVHKGRRRFESNLNPLLFISAFHVVVYWFSLHCLCQYSVYTGLQTGKLYKQAGQLNENKTKICISARQTLQLLILHEIYLIFISRFVCRYLIMNISSSINTGYDIKINFQLIHFTLDSVLEYERIRSS